MWSSVEDVQRYCTLTQLLTGRLREEAVTHGSEPVSVDDLALYLEWLDLAREAASSLDIFRGKSSPLTLGRLCYGELNGEFRSLRELVEGPVYEAVIARLEEEGNELPLILEPG